MLFNPPLGSVFLLGTPSQIVYRFREKKLFQIICRFTIPM